MCSLGVLSGRQQKTASFLTGRKLLIQLKILAPQVGLEPTTLRLTAECSAIELLRNTVAHGRKLPAVRERLL